MTMSRMYATSRDPGLANVIPGAGPVSGSGACQAGVLMLSFPPWSVRAA